jgi:hypothetical protein
MEACRLVIFRTAVRQMSDQLKMRRRVVHATLGVPVPVATAPAKQKEVSEATLIAALAEDYRVNPGLYMSMADFREQFDADEKALSETLTALEQKGLVKLYRTKKGVELAKATYEGLAKAHPPEYYRWYPSWATKERIF